jgi:cation-transporting ATPase E
MFKKKKIPVGIERYNPTIYIGLSPEQVEKRKEQNLFNKSVEHTQNTYGQIVLSNVFSLFSCILYGVAAVYIFMMIYQDSMILKYPDIVSLTTLGADSFGVTKLGFLIALIANIIIGIFQECRAKRAVEKLQLVQKQKCRVIRGGKEIDVFYDEIVLDDVVVFKSGNTITVDGPVLKGFCSVNESMLTGESKNIDKHENDIVHAGTVVSSGEVYVRADKIGEDTTSSQIKHKITEIKRKKSKLYKDLMKMIKILAIVLIPVTLMTFARQFSDVYSVLTAATTTENVLLQTRDTLILVHRMGAVIVGAIPTGLLLLSSISLASSTFMLSKKNVIIRDLYSVESLSRVDTICFDKTGTLTTGDMEVEELIPLSTLKGDKLEKLIGSYLHALPVDNASAVALIKRFTKTGDYIVSSIKPFNSETKKTMVTFKCLNAGDTYVMGAPDFIFHNDQKIIKETDSYAVKGKRVIAFGHQNADNTVEPLALIVIGDCIRESIYDTIKFFNENDVAIRVISGDAPATISAVSKKVGIPNADKTISMEGIPDEKIPDIVNDYVIFSRVTPNQKKLIVDAIQKNGHSVAMVGDGVNDIIAMKTALTSVTFASATDATKALADVVLTDNDFSHMKDVIIQGRKQVNNMDRVSSLYLMKSFFTLIYQLFMLPLGADYMLITNQTYYIVEGFIAGFGGLCLTFEKNYSKYTGKFLSNILAKSIPAAFFLVMSVVSVDILKAIPGVITGSTDAKPVWLATAMFSVAGFAIYFKQCSPFTPYRGFVFAVCLISALLFVMFMPQVFLQGDSPAFDSVHSILAFYGKGFNLSDNVLFNGEMSYTDYATIGTFAAIGIPSYYLIYNLVNLLMKKIYSSFVDEDEIKKDEKD